MQRDALLITTLATEKHPARRPSKNADCRGSTCVHPAKSFHSAFADGLGRSQSPQPHLEDGSAYRQIRSTKEDSNPRSVLLDSLAYPRA